MIIDHINLIYPTYLPNENYKTTPNTQQWPSTYSIFIII
jgi:hypothetical protein